MDDWCDPSVNAAAMGLTGDISLGGTQAWSPVLPALQEQEDCNPDISKWDTKNVINMNEMFLNAWAFGQDISSWDTSSVTIVTDIFYNASISQQREPQFRVGHVEHVTCKECSEVRPPFPTGHRQLGHFKRHQHELHVGDVVSQLLMSSGRAPRNLHVGDGSTWFPLLRVMSVVV